MVATNRTHTAHRLTTWFGGLFTGLESLRDSLAPLLDGLLADGGPVTIPQRRSGELYELFAEFIATTPVCDGAGLMLAPQLLDRSVRMQWWRRDGAVLSRTEFVLDPDSDQYYDYAALDWFQGAYESESRTVAGPYIDYLGVDYYICTVTIPAYANGRVVGAVGCDIRMQELERELLPLLAGLPKAAVLGGTRQVLVGNSGELATGVLVAAIPPGYATVPLTTDGSGLQLLYRDEPAG